MKTNTNKMVKVSMLVAIAVLLSYISIPIIPMFSWLKLDLGDLPALIGAFAFGPVVGIVIEALKVLIHFLIAGSQTGGVGDIANLLMGIALVAPASYIYTRRKTRKNALIGMIVSIIVMSIVAIISNIYILLPAYGMHMNGEELKNYILYGLIPFNLIKGVIVSGITLSLYKKLSVSIFKAEKEKKKEKKLI